MWKKVENLQPADRRWLYCSAGILWGLISSVIIIVALLGCCFIIAGSLALAREKKNISIPISVLSFSLALLSVCCGGLLLGLCLGTSKHIFKKATEVHLMKKVPKIISV
jgi:hypothetical protein